MVEVWVQMKQRMELTEVVVVVVVVVAVEVVVVVDDVVVIIVGLPLTFFLSRKISK